MAGDNSRNAVTPPRGGESDSDSGRPEMSREAEARFIVLETRLRELIDQMLAKSVKLGGRVFKSHAVVKSWLAINARASPSYIYFTDVHSLMALRVRPQLDDAAADADFESKARKVGYENTDEAHVASSFSRSLPAFFGKPTPIEARKLPTLKTAEAGESKTMVDGARDVLDRALDDANRSCKVYRRCSSDVKG